MAQYFVRFIANLDPNTKGAVTWPTFDIIQRKQLEFGNNESAPVTVSSDTYRLAPMLDVAMLSLKYPF